MISTPCAWLKLLLIGNVCYLQLGAFLKHLTEDVVYIQQDDLLYHPEKASGREQMDPNPGKAMGKIQEMKSSTELPSSVVVSWVSSAPFSVRRVCDGIGLNTKTPFAEKGGLADSLQPQFGALHCKVILQLYLK